MFIKVCNLKINGGSVFIDYDTIEENFVLVAETKTVIFNFVELYCNDVILCGGVYDFDNQHIIKNDANFEQVAELLLK